MRISFDHIYLYSVRLPRHFYIEKPTQSIVIRNETNKKIIMQEDPTPDNASFENDGRRKRQGQQYKDNKERTNKQNLESLI